MQTSTHSSRLSTLPIKLDLGAWVFWITFILSYLIGRPLAIATLGVYRAGAVLLVLAVLLFISQLRIINRFLLLSVIGLGIAILISAILNNSSLMQFLLFFRIPVTAYLVYYLVAVYLNNRRRVEKTLRIMYFIAVIQLPVLIAMRLAYPSLPARITFGALTGQMSATDFATGTFNGDSTMAFFCGSLVILLLFWDRSAELIKHKWPLAAWLTLTIFIANSQIQHVIIVGVWAFYVLINLRPRTIIIMTAGIIILFTAFILLERSEILRSSLLDQSLTKVSRIFTESQREERIDQFLEGGHARDGAILFYLEEPISWIGDGPGQYLNSITRERTRNWGHIFTFYSEVGLIGWLLSLIVFLALTFPILIKSSRIQIRVSSVQLMMFFSIVVLSIARYPMNTIGLIFTYCVVLMGYRFLDESRYLRLA